jgi:hypothetical protein
MSSCLCRFPLRLTTHYLLLGVLSISRNDDDFHPGAVVGEAVAARGPSLVRGEDDLHLVELAAGQTGKTQFPRGLGEFNLRGLTAVRVGAIHPFLETGHPIRRLRPRLSPARP